MKHLFIYLQNTSSADLAAREHCVKLLVVFSVASWLTCSLLVKKSIDNGSIDLHSHVNCEGIYISSLGL